MIPGKRSVWQRVWLCAAVGAVGVVGLCAWPYTVDDAFIVGRYADRLARGLGYTFNPGPPSDGVTGPAWLIPGLFAAKFAADPIAAAKVGGLACSLLATALVLSRLPRRAQGGRLLAIAAILIAVQPTLGCSAVSGLEAGAAALLVAIGSGAALAPLGPASGRLALARAVRLGSCVGLSAWLRPELLAFGAVLLLAFALRADRRATGCAWGLAVFGVGSIAAFRAALTGHVIPLAVAAKLGSLEDGASYVTRAVSILSGGLGLALTAAGAYWGRARDDRWLGVALLAHSVAVALAGGDWMPGFRLFAPIVTSYAALAAVGFVRLARRGHALRQAGAWACLFCACALPALDLATRLPQLWAAGASRDHVGTQIAERLRQRAKRVALVDVGYLGYASGCEVIDLGGITDREIASLPGGHLNKQISAEFLARRRPDAVLLHSSSPPTAAEDGRLSGLRGYPVEQRLAQSAWLAREFRVLARFRYGPAYYYVLLVPRASAPATDGLGPAPEP